MAQTNTKGRNVTLNITCEICKQVYPVHVNLVDFVLWAQGKHAQHAFPYLSAAERELLISQTCGSCFDRMFNDYHEIEV